MGRPGGSGALSVGCWGNAAADNFEVGRERDGGVGGLLLVPCPGGRGWGWGALLVSDGGGGGVCPVQGQK